VFKEKEGLPNVVAKPTRDKVFNSEAGDEYWQDQYIRHSEELEENRTQGKCQKGDLMEGDKQ